MLGAVFGAIAGALITIIIEIIKWIHGRYELKKTIRKGLYYEMDNHVFHDHGYDSNNQPNMFFESFHDSFYTNNLSLIFRSLDAEFLQILSFYYSKCKLAKDFQDNIVQLRSEIKGLKIESESADMDKAATAESQMREKEKVHANYLELLRVTIIPLAFIRRTLLDELKTVFGKNDPSNLAFIDVSDEHQEWWKTINKGIK